MYFQSANNPGLRPTHRNGKVFRKIRRAHSQTHKLSSFARMLFDRYEISGELFHPLISGLVEASQASQLPEDSQLLDVEFSF